MTKQFLDAAEVGSAVKEVGGEAILKVWGLAADARPAVWRCASSSRATLREESRDPR